MCITTNQPDTEYNLNLDHNPNPTTKQHAIVSIQLIAVTCPTYQQKLIWDVVVAPFLQSPVVIVSQPSASGDLSPARLPYICQQIGVHSCCETANKWWWWWRWRWWWRRTLMMLRILSSLQCPTTSQTRSPVNNANGRVSTGLSSLKTISSNVVPQITSCAPLLQILLLLRPWHYGLRYSYTEKKLLFAEISQKNTNWYTVSAVL